MFKPTLIILVAALTITVSAGHAHAQKASYEVQATKIQARARAHTQELRPYDADRDAMADVDAALARAQSNGTRTLIVMGAHWCHDSRALATRLNTPAFRTLISESYELVYVSAGSNPGQNDQNRDVSKRFGVDKIEGTPTVFITDENGTVLNADSAGYWRRAESVPTDMTLAYFDHYTGK